MLEVPDYILSITRGLVKLIKYSPKLEIKLEIYIIKLTKEFFKNLNKLDPLVNERIKPNDVQRSIRAYEVKLFTKKSIFDWFKETKSKFKNREFLKLYIDFPRSDLIERINVRTKKMLENGSLMEVRKFLRLRIPENKSITKAIGIEEIKDLINKKLTYEQVIEKISIKTRQYAKRQVTWARGNMKDWKKIKPKNLDKLLKKI